MGKLSSLEHGEMLKRIAHVMSVVKKAFKSNGLKYRETTSSSKIMNAINQAEFRIKGGPKLNINVQKDFVLLTIDGKEQRPKTDKDLEKAISKITAK